MRNPDPNLRRYTTDEIKDIIFEYKDLDFDVHILLSRYLKSIENAQVRLKKFKKKQKEKNGKNTVHSA